MKRIINYLTSNSRSAEILRFLIIGGFATLIDFLISAFVILLYYQFSNIDYQFLDIFFKSDLPTLIIILSTAFGFLFGVIFNYVFSLFFVFKESGSSKTVKGMSLFLILALIGLLIHLLGMYLLVDLAKFNYWIIRVSLTLLVLVFNYFTRKIIIFKNNEKVKQ